MVSNTGTYLDTPFHRFADGHDLAGLDPARVADVPGVLVDGTVGQEVGAAALAGLDLAGRAVLVHTGWDRHWGSGAYGDAERHPYLGVDAAEALVAAGAAVVGIDSVNIDGTRTGSGRSTRPCSPPASRSSNTCGASTPSPAGRSGSSRSARGGAAWARSVRALAIVDG